MGGKDRLVIPEVSREEKTWKRKRYGDFFFGKTLNHKDWRLSLLTPKRNQREGEGDLRFQRRGERHTTRWFLSQKKKEEKHGKKRG